MIVERGFPQGTSVTPLLFSIFTNDLPKVSSYCKLHVYADDTVINTSNFNKYTIEGSLQLDFTSIQKWVFLYKLLLNKKKSWYAVLRVSAVP